jgi:hypothetical protein
MFRRYGAACCLFCGQELAQLDTSRDAMLSEVAVRAGGASLLVSILYTHFLL